MKGGIRVIGVLSVVLLISVCIGQGIWLIKIREVKRNEFRQLITFTLSGVTDEFLGNEYVDPLYNFSCGLNSDGKTFTWGKGNKTIKISSFRNYNLMTKLVFYDHLYENHFLNLKRMDSLYRKRLAEKGVSERPVLMIWEESTQRTLMTTDSLSSFKGKLFTLPVNIGYEYKHQLVAAFPEPFIFRSMIKHLVWQGVFLLGFVLSLIWQWRRMRMTWQSAKVQTMGMAHLEHELKKPLATMISVVGGIVDRKNRELTEIQERKLKLVRARLLKMADVTDTMMTALKTSEFKIDREDIDIRLEMELVAEMFKVLRPQAKVNFQIEEGIEKPRLDKVYFIYLVINLVDNGIKYGSDQPEIKVAFRKEEEYWVLTVADNGIGIPAKALKRIFRQFYRVNDKRVTAKTGFGLGLAFVKKVVDAYGGEIQVESEPGRGSVFTVKIKDAGKEEKCV